MNLLGVPATVVTIFFDGIHYCSPGEIDTNKDNGTQRFVQIFSKEGRFEVLEIEDENFVNHGSTFFVALPNVRYQSVSPKGNATVLKLGELMVSPTFECYLVNLPVGSFAYLERVSGNQPDILFTRRLSGFPGATLYVGRS